MATLQRRVQILFDPAQYALLEEEAAQQQRSVASVVRLAVAAHLERRQTSKPEALARLLDRADRRQVPVGDWQQEKDELDSDRFRSIP